MANLLYYVRTKSFILRRRYVFFKGPITYSVIVNPLTPGQIIFCLADTENHKFNDSRTFSLFRILTKLEAIIKSLLNFC